MIHCFLGIFPLVFYQHPGLEWVSVILENIYEVTILISLITLNTKLLLLLSCFSRVQLCVTPQTAAHQTPLSLGFSRQEYWSGLPFPSPRHKARKFKLPPLEIQGYKVCFIPAMIKMLIMEIKIVESKL